MKGLRKYLTPFAPDQSGAVSVCYALGGMVVIVDAGGCAGNICGFDEPRWQSDYLTPFGDTDPVSHEGAHKRVEAVFSAGLRDMDAILGRDDLLVKKLAEASKQIDVKFIALVGTPVPAVIGTDLAADAAMAERITQLPCIAVSTDGMHLYDRGIEEALLALMKRFAGSCRADSEEGAGEKADSPSSSDRLSRDSERRVCGVLGLNVLDLYDPAWTRAIRVSLKNAGYDEVLLYGMDKGLDALRESCLAERNYVVSPAGLAAAKYLEERFHTPYEVCFPADPMIVLEEDPFTEERIFAPDTKILVVHQQVMANSIRSSMRSKGVCGNIVAATWFDQKPELAAEGDVRLREEDDFADLVQNHSWDMIIADPVLRPIAGAYQGRWIDACHFAVSGQAAIDRTRRKDRMQERTGDGEKVEVWRI